MKQLFLILLASTTFSFCTASCEKEDKITTVHNNDNSTDTINPSANKMKITIGSTVFTATLNDNATVQAIIARLPITITMSELNSNEKFFYFSSTFPTNASPGGGIKAGDLMLYGNNCLVLFYENINTSYSYTRLGKIDDVRGLKAALGTGDITVKFELQ